MAKKSTKEPNYFVMTCEGLYPAAAVRAVTDVPGGPWFDGQPLKIRVPEPVVFAVDPDYPGDLKPFYKGAVPLMRDDLLKSLTEAGVDNLQLFPAVVRDKKKKTEYTNFKVFNVLGVISAANMGESTLMGTSGSTKINVDFDSLVLDESKIGGALLFRLAESVSAIVVHKKVKAHIEASKIPGMTFYGPGEWSG
jgi:hypothetical protein